MEVSHPYEDWAKTCLPILEKTELIVDFMCSEGIETPGKINSKEWMTIYHWNYQLATSNESPHLAEWLYIRYQGLIREYLKKCITPKSLSSLAEVNALLRRFYSYARQLIKFFNYIDRYYVARNSVSSLAIAADETLLTFLLQAHDKDIHGCLRRSLDRELSSKAGTGTGGIGEGQELREYSQTAKNIASSIAQPQLYTGLVVKVANFFRAQFDKDKEWLMAIDSVQEMVAELAKYADRIDTFVKEHLSPTYRLEIDGAQITAVKK